MRYGKSEGRHELDPTLRRKPHMSLKKAQPGAPFGWAASGEPYIGTQYCVRGTEFASLSTRNGTPQYFWKPLKGLTKKVALSALETHGTVGGLLAGTSGFPCAEVLPAEELAAVRRVFVKLLGEETVALMEKGGGDLEPKAEQGCQKAGSGVKTEEKGAEAIGTSRELGAVKSEVGEEPSCKVGDKRKARMQMVDKIVAATKARAETVD